MIKQAVGFSLVPLSRAQSERTVSQKNGSDDMFAFIAFNSQVIWYAGAWGSVWEMWLYPELTHSLCGISAQRQKTTEVWI